MKDMHTQGLAYTYIVLCADGTLYTGWTNRLEERIRCHNAGKGRNIPGPGFRYVWYITRFSTQNRKLCSGSMP